jgi:hypothetical protein
MKTTSQTTGVKKLAEFRERFRSIISDNYEHRARACSACETPGACCLDAHFVNVRISRLEAAAIAEVLADLTPDHRQKVYDRIRATISLYKLDNDANTFACPLYEKENGCLVHGTAKPFPCIQHACYERNEDLAPDELLDEAELAVDRLNRKVYVRSLPLMSLPVAVRDAQARA